MAENNLNQMRFIQPIRSVVGFPTYEGAIGHVNGLIPEFSSNAKSDGVSVVARYKDGTDAEGKDIYKMLHAIYSKKDNKFTFFVHDVESLKESIVKAIEKLDVISEKYKVKFILSVSKDIKDLPECAKAKVIISL